MKRTLVVTIACLGLALLGLTGCATKAPAPETMEAQVQIEAEEFEVAEQPSDPCTTIEGALARAGMLTDVSFDGATQYDGAIRFAFDSYALSEEAKETIDSFVGPLVEADNYGFLELQGHTDGFGVEAYNFQLGLARARAVMRTSSAGWTGSSPTRTRTTFAWSISPSAPSPAPSTGTTPSTRPSWPCGARASWWSPPPATGAPSP